MSKKTTANDYLKIINDCGITTKFPLGKEQLAVIENSLSNVAVNPYKILDLFNFIGKGLYISKPEFIFDFTNKDDKFYLDAQKLLIHFDTTFDPENKSLKSTLNRFSYFYTEENFGNSSIWENKTELLDFLIPGFSISSAFLSETDLPMYINNNLSFVVSNCLKTSVLDKIDKLSK